MSPSSKHLVLTIDGASRGNPGPSAIGIVIKNAQGKVLKEIGEHIGEFTNNVAEYRALLRALEEAKTMGAASVEVRSDSDLLVSQLQGSYKVKSPDLGPLYLDAIRLLRGCSVRARLRRVRRNARISAGAGRATAGSASSQRKVRTPKGRALGNSQWGRPQGKCHRNIPPIGNSSYSSPLARGRG